MFTKVYLHGSKEDMFCKGEELGLTGQALKNFTYACYEVEIGLEVDEKTGEYEIVSIDGKNVE